MRFRQAWIIGGMRIWVAIAGALTCLALLAGGCGSDDSGTAGGTTAAGSTGPKGGAPDSEKRNSSGSGESGGAGSGSGESNRGSGSGGSTNSPALAKEFEAPKGGDDSIQTFGEVAEREEDEEIVASMRAFFNAMANKEYAEICSSLSEANREQLESLLKRKDGQGDCAAALKKLLARLGPEAKQAARGTVYQVRVEGDTAFVLFVPAGGVASYFVMKREDGGWKSINLTTGTPLEPTAQR